MEAVGVGMEETLSARWLCLTSPLQLVPESPLWNPRAPQHSLIDPLTSGRGVDGNDIPCELFRQEELQH